MQTMTPAFTALPSWASLPRLRIDALCDRLPLLKQRIEAFDAVADDQGYDCYLDNDDERDFILLMGDFFISDAQLDALRDDDEDALIVVVGSLRVESRARQVFYVSGDLHCSSIALDDYGIALFVDGGIKARDCAILEARDDRRLISAPAMRLDTRYLFCWFYDIDAIALCPDAVVAIVGGWDYCNSVSLANPIVRWHDGLHVFDPRFLLPMDDYVADVPNWDYRLIEAALLRGESILKPGYDIASIAWEEAGREAARAGEQQTAWLRFRQAASISPASYVAVSGMADALTSVGALAQALPLYARAGSLFPQDQRALANDALTMAALCALRCRDLTQALALADASIAHHAPQLRRSEFAPPYRVRGEALLLLGRQDEAARALALALEHNQEHPMAHWLSGLLSHLSGEQARARAQHKEAVRFAGTALPAYTEQQDTDFQGAPGPSVDWDQLPADAASLSVKDQAYWCAFMRGRPGHTVTQVPPAYRSRALLEQLIGELGTHTESDFVGHFPGHAFSRASAELLVRRSAHNLRYIPPALIDKALCMLAPVGGFGFDLAAVPEQYVDAELCRHALQSGCPIDAMPARFVDHGLCLLAVQSNPRNLFALPAALVDDAIVAAAIGHGNGYFFDNNLPHRYKRPHLLQRAVRDYKQSLDAIPGHRFDSALFELAQQCHGQDSDWPDVLARHDQRSCMRQRELSAHEQCWAAFWDEAFMVSQIGKKNAYLAPWLIPDALFSKAVAEACFKHHAIHLDAIPRRFIDQAMCDRFSKKYPARLAQVPVALRSAAICKAAVKAEAENIRRVPLALRSVDLCVLALLADPVLDSAIPPERRAAVDERLLKKHKAQFDACAAQRAAGAGAGAPLEPRDFDRNAFSALVQDLERLIAAHHDQSAYLVCLEAEALLTASASCDAYQWAYVLDKKRYLSYELGMWEENEATCRTALATLELNTMFEYASANNAVRRTLRACYFRLASLTEYAGMSLPELEHSRTLMKKLFSLKGPGENAKVFDPFRGGRARLLAVMAARDARYRAEFERVAKDIQSA
jgi:tetratricopeptide (TPR) repeat protein